MRQKRTIPTFNELTDFVKDAACCVFDNNRIAYHIHKTIKDAKFEYIEEVLDDLNRRLKCHIITEATESIRCDLDISQKWTKDDKTKLYEMLINIYKKHIMDINKIGCNTSVDIDNKTTRNPFKSKVISIVYKINKTLRMPIDIKNVRRFFEAESRSFNATNIVHINSKEFKRKANKYNIKPHHATLILTELKIQYDDKYAEKRERMCLRKGSECKIYSKSQKKWFPAEIIDTVEDAEGEWLHIRYYAGGIARIKEIQRYNDHIQPATTQQTITFPQIPLSPSLIERQNTAPLPIIVDEAKKPLWMSKKMQKRLSMLSLPRIPSASMSPSGDASPNGAFLLKSTPLTVDTSVIERESSHDIRHSWDIGSVCEIHSHKLQRWIRAEIIKIFYERDQEWFLLKCEDSQIRTKMRYDTDLRSQHPQRIKMTHSYSFGSQLMTQFDERSMSSLLKKLEKVIDVINHEIDSTHNFLYQVYHIDDDENIEKYITYENAKAMQYYNDTIKQKYSTSMLCNGKTMYEYGNVEEYQECTDEAEIDYNKIYESLHSTKLDKIEIMSEWQKNETEYDQRWLLSVKKEEFIAKVIETFGVDTVQNGIKLYEKLVCAVKYKEEEAKDNILKETCDIMALWTKKDTEASSQIQPLDHIHFLYIVSIILESLLKGDEKLQIVDTNAILRCLNKTQMNGLLFSKIDEHAFVGSVIMHSHSFKEVKILRLAKLVEIATKLYQELHLFELESIKPSSIFSIPLSNHTEHKETHIVEEFSVFEQWMISFDSQYNRSTPFNNRVFKHLIETYNKDPNAIIDIKYDNYSKELNQKTYDHVLKSFIATSITTKCSKLRCEETLKLCCFCDINKYQKFTYKIIMGIIELKANNDYSLLNKLADAETPVCGLSAAVCDILPDELKQTQYFKTYKTFIVDWINFDFYNFRCEYCQHINKTIMINRVYQYSKTMQHCRVCNNCQISRLMNNSPQFDMHRAIRKKEFNISDKGHYDCSEFNLHSLFEYLASFDVDQKVRLAFAVYLEQEDYDSESVMDDIKDTRENSNIYRLEYYLKLDANAVQSSTISLYEAVKKYLSYDQYPQYKIGKLYRYIVLRPKYFSLLKEMSLNDIHPLSLQWWEIKILPAVIKQYDEQSVFSNDTDKRFGIEVKEPIGIHHLVAIFLFVDDKFNEYRSALTRTYWLYSQNMHCNNFYWTGRYLYEAVQFYGQKFGKSKGCFMQGIRQILSFNSVAPVFNVPTLTTDNKRYAQKFAGRGCILTLRPKYIGDIDNSKLLYCNLFNREIRLLNRTKVQIESIQTIHPKQTNLKPIVLAIHYIEKILLQTPFDAHFHNSDGLYYVKTKRTAFQLINDRIGRKTSDDETVALISDYARHLFDNWCIRRDFVTFETFKLEMNYMDYDLKQFLFSSTYKKIKITNVVKFLPNLKYYHDIKGRLRNVSKEMLKSETRAKSVKILPNTDIAINGVNDPRNMATFGLLYNCQSHDIPYHIVNALGDIHFNFSTIEVLYEAFRQKLSNLDISHKSFYENRSYFSKQLISIGISQKVAKYCIENIIENREVHARTKRSDLIKFILDLLKPQFNQESVRCDLFSQKEAFKKKHAKDLAKFITILEKRNHEHHDHKITITELYNVAKDIEIFKKDHETAMKLSKYLYIKMMDDKEKIVSWVCETCQFLNCELMVNGLWRHYNEGNKCGLCGDPRYIIKNNVTKSKDKETPNKYLLRRKTLQFLKHSSRSILTPRTPRTPANNFSYALSIDTKEVDNMCIDPDFASDLPFLNEWNKIEEIAECQLFKTVAYLSHKQLIYLVENHFIDKVIESDDKLKLHQKKLLSQNKEKIISYFKKEQMDGITFNQLKKNKFCKSVKTFCEDKKLSTPLIKLFGAIKKCDLSKINDIPNPEHQSKEEVSYEELMKDCPAFRRINMVLDDFEKIDVFCQHSYYPYEMNMYLSYFPGYSPIPFLNDIDHIIKHKVKHPQKCKQGTNCIHIQRALRDRKTAKCRSLELKKQFFHTENQMDFVYISMLDRAHCLLKHSHDIKNKTLNKSKVKKKLADDVKTSQHLPYNTGVFMEYHTLKPLYQNLFDEIIHNKALQIAAEQVESDLEASKLFLKTDTVITSSRACKTDKKYGIKVNEAIHIEHVLCIKFYCNYSNLCETFRRSYRKYSAQETNEDVIRRHCNDHYWFGRFLTTAIEFWGHIPTTTDKFYHGLVGQFVFHHFSAVYEIPTSTTNDATVAHNFSDDSGIVLKLAPKYTHEVNNSRYLDVSGLSEFKEEKEKLFAGMTVLSIVNIYNPSDNAWNGYRDYVASFLYFERIIEQTIHQKYFYNFGQLAIEKQKSHLIPLLKHQMKRNSHNDDSDEKIHEDDIENDGTQSKIPSYICTLFEFFCDNKRDYINLSCINKEISFMCVSLQHILFEQVQFDENILQQYKINNKNVKLIFPNLMEYKNHLGHWIYVGSKHKSK